MSIRVMSIVWSRFPAGGSKLLTMLALADWADDDGTKIYPSMETLAGKCRMSERQIRRIIGELVKENFLELTKKSAGGVGQTNHYSINLETLSNCPGYKKQMHDLSQNPVTDDRKPGHSYVRQSVISVNNHQAIDPVEKSKTPVDNSNSVEWGSPAETKLVALSSYIRQLEKMPDNMRPPEELERARIELDQLKLQAGET